MRSSLLSVMLIQHELDHALDRAERHHTCCSFLLARLSLMLLICSNSVAFHLFLPRHELRRRLTFLNFFTPSFVVFLPILHRFEPPSHSSHPKLIFIFLDHQCSLSYTILKSSDPHTIISPSNSRNLLSDGIARKPSPGCRTISGGCQVIILEESDTSGVSLQIAITLTELRQYSSLIAA